MGRPQPSAGGVYLQADLESANSFFEMFLFNG
jgi:hypothetical protein